MAFRVEISAQAEHAAEAILEWLLSQRTGQTGIDWFPALDDAFGSLAEFPERCPIAPESARFLKSVSQFGVRFKRGLCGRSLRTFRHFFPYSAKRFASVGE
jgi:hypothetical protein